MAATLLDEEIVGAFQRGLGNEPGGRFFFIIEPELHLGSHVVVPGIACWWRERLTAFPDTAFIDTVPDWVCEVLSPSTMRLDRSDKLRFYGEFGVGHCWYVDPEVCTLEVLALTAGR